MTNDELLSKTISCLRFPLMVGVVFIHFNIANGFVLHGAEYGTNYPEWYYCIINFFSGVLPCIGVPLFFFFSGFLFFYHTDFNLEAYKKKLKSRARTLLVPYLLWNLIAIVWRAKRMLPFVSASCPIPETELNLSLPAILQTFWNHQEGIFPILAEDTVNITDHNIYPIDFPMWYVRDLMIVVLCASLLYWLIRKAKYYPVIVLGLLWYVLKSLAGLGYPSMLITAFFFFSWGAYYSINRLDFTASFRKLPFVPFVYVGVAIIDTLTKGQDYNGCIHMAGIILGIISVVGIAAALLEKGKIRANEFLANASFFLFASHALLLGTLRTVMVLFVFVHFDSPWCFLFFYFLVPAFTILVCLALYKGLKKCFPSFLMLLTGGR